MNLQEDILIVGYGNYIALVTTDKKEAEEKFELCKKKQPNFNWGVRNISETIQEASDISEEKKHEAYLNGWNDAREEYYTN